MCVTADWREEEDPGTDPGLSQDMLQIMSSFVVALVLERETSGDVDVVVVVRCCHFLGNS